MSFPSLARMLVLMFLVSMPWLEPVSSAVSYESAPQQSTPPSKARAACGIEMRTDTGE